MTKQFTTATDNGITTRTFGETSHGSYYVTFCECDMAMFASLWLGNEDGSDFEIATTQGILYACREDMREAVAQMMAQVVRSGHDLAALHILADLAECVR